MTTFPSSFEGLSASLSRLSNSELLEQVERLAGDERNATARLVASLAEVDRRQLYRNAGYSSLFTYCTGALKLSESESYLRIEAARAALRFPVILERLAEASITLTAVSKIARHLTEENHVTLLDSVCHKSKREIEELLACVDPRPDAKEMVRRLPVKGAGETFQTQPEKMPPARADECSRGDRSGDPALPARGSPAVAHDRIADAVSRRRAASLVQPVTVRAAADDDGADKGADADRELRDNVLFAEPAANGSASHEPVTCTTPLAVPAAGPRDSVTPLSHERYRVQLTIGAETNEKLRRVRDLLRHQVPDRSLEKVFDLAITRLLANLEKEKFAATARPERRHSPAKPRKMPRGVAKMTNAKAPCPPEPREGRAPAAKAPTAPAPPADLLLDELPSKTSTPSVRRRSRYIAAAVRREVWQRDEGRCTFVGLHGRCAETSMLEYHHCEPFAVGGEATVAGVKLLCRAHNALEAERYFGPTMPRRTRQAVTGVKLRGCGERDGQLRPDGVDVDTTAGRPAQAPP